MGDSISPKDFGASFTRFMEQMAHQAPAEEPYFHKRLAEHFAADPAQLTIVTERFEDADHPNVHLAIEAYLANRSFELLGISSDTPQYFGVTFAQLISRGTPARYSSLALGPVTYTNIALDSNRILACTQTGLYLVRDGDARLAILVYRPAESPRGGLIVEVLAPDRSSADAWFAEMRTAMRARNVYRGHVVSLSAGNTGLRVRFHRLPPIARDQLILPAGVLERVERHTLGFAQHATRLAAAGRHLKRGLLLHGAPGTGKTLTAMYLAGATHDRTVLMVTGRGMGLLEQACAMARALQPATVILEDIDLIAEERTRPGIGCAPLLFELLNQMDGLDEDADILFVLTTNRPDLLEPALAARPGRIDQAIEVPVPDAECRRRLFALYGRGLALACDVEPYVVRTAGASAAFIRELLRKAALFAADDAADLTVGAKQLDEALHEMVVVGGDLTRSLLGAAVPAS